MMRASACSRTASRSLKTESLRTILPLHSIIARSFKFSTRIDNIEFSDCLSLQEPCQGGGLYFSALFSRIRHCEVLKPSIFGRLSGNVFLQRTLYICKDSSFDIAVDYSHGRGEIFRFADSITIGRTGERHGLEGW